MPHSIFGAFFRNTVIEKLLLKSMRILAGIRRFWRALSLSGGTAGKAASVPRRCCVYVAILTFFSIPKVFAGDSIPLSNSQQKFVDELAAQTRVAESKSGARVPG